MSVIKSTIRLIANARQFSRTAPRNADQVHEGYKKIKLIQAQFQKADGLPIHLKGGPMDKVLFGTTVVLCFVGMGMMLEMIYTLSNPPKND